MKHFFSIKFLLSLVLITISILSVKPIPHAPSCFYDESPEDYYFTAQFFVTTPDNLSESFTISGFFDSEDYLLFRTSGLASALNEINYTDFATIFSDIDEKWWGIDVFSNDIYENFDKNLIDSVRDFLDNLGFYVRTGENDLKFHHEEDGIFLDASVKISRISNNSVEYPAEYSDFSEFFIHTFEN